MPSQRGAPSEGLKGKPLRTPLGFLKFARRCLGNNISIDIFSMSLAVRCAAEVASIKLVYFPHDVFVFIGALVGMATFDNFFYLRWLVSAGFEFLRSFLISASVYPSSSAILNI